MRNGTVRVARAYLKSAAIGALLFQCLALVCIALLGVDEAAFKTPEFRCWAAAAILASAGLVRVASRMANAHIAAVNCVGVDASDRKVAHQSVAALLQFLSRIDHCFSVEKDDGKASPR
ncbi:MULTISPECIES: hypothetical protein [Paraburkholderia]|uniref:hypothetical protein n=1 Tax=Paraburkholderia TaxID=1822464 RepID=UPI0038B8F3B2